MTKMLPIHEVAKKLHIPDKYFQPLGPYGAKIGLGLLTDPSFPRRGKMILVTATTPTVSGEGKTVTAISLTQGLAHIGKSVVITSREPSLGPVFGMKGGAAGGGSSQLEPSQKINLHFHGDFHAITSAHNLLSALIDAHLFHGNDLQLDPDKITWPRALDMNDRALRQVTVAVGGKRDGANRASKFVITAASEIMAILALATNREDLRRRLSSIIIGVDRSGRPVQARELDAVGGMMVLLDDALLPNLVQTTDGTPAFVHAGPFANIAHGTSSVISQDMALRLADYVINEAGFASDLGAEKFINIVAPSSGIAPSAAVLVTTVQSLRNQGQGDLNVGFSNLDKHMAILKSFGLPVIVAINHFPKDTEADLLAMEKYCADRNVKTSRVEGFANGGPGAADLAHKIVATLEKNPAVTIHPAYTAADSAEQKIEKVARNVYGASDVSFSDQARDKLQLFAKWGYQSLPVCIAKTQYSLSDNPRLPGAPTGWTLNISDASLSAGAGFIVAIAGNMVLMPGLPKVSRASQIDLAPDGSISGV